MKNDKNLLIYFFSLNFYLKLLITQHFFLLILFFFSFLYFDFILILMSIMVMTNFKILSYCIYPIKMINYFIIKSSLMIFSL